MKFTKNQWLQIIAVVATVITGFFVFLDGENPSNIENNTATNTGVNLGLVVGKMEVDSQRILNDVSKQNLVNKILGYEKNRDKKFHYVVVSASPDAESQNFAKDIIAKLTQLNTWKIIPRPLIVFSRDIQPDIPRSTDVIFDLSDQYSYKNSIEVIVLDK